MHFRSLLSISSVYSTTFSAMTILGPETLPPNLCLIPLMQIFLSHTDFQFPPR